MPVTSQLRADTRQDDVPVSAWKAAGLLKPSAIKPLLATFEQSLVLRKLGVLEDTDASSLRTALAQIIG